MSENKLFNDKVREAFREAQEILGVETLGSDHWRIMSLMIIAASQLRMANALVSISDSAESVHLIAERVTSRFPVMQCPSS